MQAWHQKNILDPEYPFLLIISDDLEFPPHWHDEMELVYVLEGRLQVGLAKQIHTLAPQDILIIGRGEVHYFINSPQEKSRVAILQFGLMLFEALTPAMGSRRFLEPHIMRNLPEHTEVSSILNSTLSAMVSEYMKKREGYQLAMKARLYDLLVSLARELPYEACSDIQRRKQLSRLERLEQVFRFVDENYSMDIRLKDAASVASFSVYHFTRFFKEATGMTFGRYLNGVRIRKAQKYLLSIDNSITEVAFRVGFNSIKTFNRLFKNEVGCSPTDYRLGKYMNSGNVQSSD
jgi:AraC-like DNA-binding protein